MRERKPRRLDAEALWSYALKALAARAHSSGEMKQKMLLRAAREEDVDEILGRLKDSGYLDDRRFAEGFAASRLTNDKFGRTRVIQDLRQRRVAPELAERSVRSVYAGVDEQRLINEWIRQKYRFAGREGLFQDEKDLAAAYRRLLRAGFKTGEILSALKRFARNPDLLDGFDPPEETPGEE